jgi:hypothetical protein
MVTRRKLPPWLGCSHPSGADRCARPVYVTARRLDGSEVRLCAECAAVLDEAGMLAVGSARRV